MSDTKLSRLRVFVDTNVIISAILSQTSVSARFLHFVILEHELLICSYTLEEIQRVIERKFPNRISLWHTFLAALEYELIETPMGISDLNPLPIRDVHDVPILSSALLCEPNYLVTGDHDFFTEVIQSKFLVISPGDFLEKYSKHNRSMN